MTARWLRALAAIVIAAVSVGMYIWNARETMADETRGARRYRIQVYRFRPITEFQFDHDENVYRSDRTAFGATRIIRIDSVRWLGSSTAVMLNFAAGIDSGGSENHRLYYDFGTGTLLTTLNGSKDATRLDAILRE
jgi:hypothetical protein